MDLFLFFWSSSTHHSHHFVVCYATNINSLSVFYVGHPPCHFFCLSVTHPISGTVHHVIIIFGTRVKLWYLQAFFSFFQNFDFSSSKKTKNSVGQAPYLRNYTLYDCHLWYACVKWYIQVFFSFFQNFDFLGC